MVLQSFEKVSSACADEETQEVRFPPVIDCSPFYRAVHNHPLIVKN